MRDVVEIDRVERYSLTSGIFVFAILLFSLLTVLLMILSRNAILDIGVLKTLPFFLFTGLSLYTTITLFLRIRPKAITVTMTNKSLSVNKFGVTSIISWEQVTSVRAVNFVFGRPARAAGVIVTYGSDIYHQKTMLIRDPFAIHRTQLAAEIGSFRQNALALLGNSQDVAAQP